ncbi:MAG: putative bifunctional diguanylate cyclase/phosphodiesterase [Acidiferrobacteraceae bacterium]
MPAVLPRERERLAALRRLNVLDTAPEERFDRFTRIAKQLFDVPASLISLIDADRQWFKSRQGVSVCETPRDISFCAHAITQGGLMIVPDTHLDPRFSDNPLVTHEPLVRFYAGRTLEDEDGNRLGTFCVLDTRPRQLDAAGQQALNDLAACVERELGVVQSLYQSHTLLKDQEVHLRAILDNVAGVILTLDAGGTVESINPRVAQVFGYVPDEVIGRPVGMLLPEAHGQTLGSEHDVLRIGTREARGRRRDGESVPLEIAVSRMGPEGAHRFIVIARDISERLHLVEIVRRQAYYDVLTGLPNRVLLAERIKERLTRSPVPPLALIMLGLDRLRDINNTLGHPIGDLLLQQVGPRLHPLLGGDDVLTYAGSGVFALLLTGADEGQAREATGRAQQVLAPPFALEQVTVDVDVSAGIALCPDHGNEPGRLMQHADVALQAARQSSHKFLVYAPERDPYSPRRLALMNALSEALDRNQIFLVYQPKVDLKTGRTLGVEALARWQHHDLGLIGPDEFIPMAEHSGFIKPLTLWVLRTALHQCAAWHREGLDLSVAVNISARNLQDQSLPDQVVRALVDAGLAARWLELEITESMLMVDPVHAMALLARLDKMGVRLSIDDFGTGYSSLSYLKKLPVRAVKIDKSFVMDMVGDSDDATIVRSTIDMAHHLGLRVIAEGVENPETWDRLFASGCDEAQGYHMSRPLPADALGTWLRNSPWAPGIQKGPRARAAAPAAGKRPVREPRGRTPRPLATRRALPKLRGSSQSSRPARRPRADRP